MVILFLLLIGVCHSQNTKKDYNAPQFFDYVTNSGVISFFIPNAGSSYESILGSPYLIKDYKEGFMIVDDSIYVRDIRFRYNIFKEEMEICYNKEYRAIRDHERVNKIVFDDRSFIYSDYILDDAIEEGYLEVLSAGKVTLLKKYKCTILEPNYNKAMSSGIKNQRFSIKEFYVLKKESEKEKAIIFKPGKKAIFELLPDKKEQISVYIKENKIIVRKDAGLKKVIEYYNSL